MDLYDEGVVLRIHDQQHMIGVLSLAIGFAITDSRQIKVMIDTVTGKKNRRGNQRAQCDENDGSGSPEQDQREPERRSRYKRSRSNPEQGKGDSEMQNGLPYWQKNSKEVNIRQAVCLTRAGRLSIKKWTTVKLHNIKFIIEEKKQVKEEGK